MQSSQKQSTTTTSASQTLHFTCLQWTQWSHSADTNPQSVVCGLNRGFKLYKTKVNLSLMDSYNTQYHIFWSLFISCGHSIQKPASTGWDDSHGRSIKKKITLAFRHLPPNSARFVTPLKGHSLSPHSCPATWSASYKGLGTNMTVEVS